MTLHFKTRTDLYT